MRKLLVLESILEHSEIADKKLQAIARSGLGGETTELRIAAIRCCARMKMKAAVSPLMAMVKKYERADYDTHRYALLGLAQILLQLSVLAIEPDLLLRVEKAA